MRTLSPEKKAEIRRLRAMGHTYRRIAEVVGCNVDSARSNSLDVQLDQSLVEKSTSKHGQFAKMRTARPSWFEDEDVGRMVTAKR